jgi:hypothetical protein
MCWLEGYWAELLCLYTVLTATAPPSSGEDANPEETRLLARCYQRLALWHGQAKGLTVDAALPGQRAVWTDADIATVDDCYSQAAELDRDWFKVSVALPAPCPPAFLWLC